MTYSLMEFLVFAIAVAVGISITLLAICVIIIALNPVNEYSWKDKSNNLLNQ